MAWSDKIKGRREGVADVDLSVHGLNIETDRLPFGDGEFDLVVAMEILEHFVIDPGFVFREVNRVLRVGGVFMATTPNLVSLQAIGRALHGGSPYSFGVYVPTNGVYGRHNREFTPREVESLAVTPGSRRVLSTPRTFMPRTTARVAGRLYGAEVVSAERAGAEYFLSRPQKPPRGARSLSR